MKPPERQEEQRIAKPNAQTNGYDRIFALGPDKVAILNSYLITETYSMERIIEVLKKEWGVFPDVSDTALRRQLFRYKKDFILPKQAQIAVRLTTDKNVGKLAAAANALQKNVDVLSELKWAIEAQKERLVKLKAKEDQMPMPLEVMTKNLLLYANQLKELAQIQLQIGVLRKVPTRVALSADITDEDVKFLESAQLHQVESAATLEAVRYLKDQGLLREGRVEPRSEEIEAEFDAVDPVEADAAAVDAPEQEEVAGAGEVADD